LKKRPLLQVLSDLYPHASREELYARILCGEVAIGGQRIRDPKYAVRDDMEIVFSRKRYVSRGGEKLEYALACTGFEVEGKVALDAGSSTGGFTDCLLQHGAARVHAGDVGKNQLAYELRIDPRVTVHENTNIMTAPPFVPESEIAVADISFRSLRHAAARIIDLTSEKKALVLAKPQFEWPKEDTSFRGVLSNTGDIRAVLRELTRDLAAEGVYVHSVVPSPITGRKGNREFFLLILRTKTRELEEAFRLIDGALRESQRFS